MKTDIVLSPILRENFPDSYESSKSQKNEEIWRQLGHISVEDALHLWLETLRRLTRENYYAGFKRLDQLNLVNFDSTLQQFSLINHETIIDEIKLVHYWSEATRQARAAAYISFTGFLQRRTQGIIHKAVSNKEGYNKTFFKVREKVKTNALSKIETRCFFQEIEKINVRDALMAKLLLQGGKRKVEVLGLNIEQIDFVSQTITFVQTKTRGMEKVTVINYPPHIMSELKEYVGQRSGLVFITQNGHKISPFQLDRNFLKAGERAHIPFRVTPHVLRVTLVTRLKELKVQDSDIMKITGHANPAQLSSYDKSDLSDNATLHHHFV